MAKKKDKQKDKKYLARIKTGRWERQWSVTKAGVTAGSGAATQMLGSAFLSKDKRQHRNKKILSKQALYLANEFGKLKGSVVKVGQMMALYGEHILPAEVTDAFRTLEEHTTALSWDIIEDALQRELGDKITEFDIDPVPIGAASLAQVHKAWHKPSDTWLCLKIQYPGIADSIDSDLKAVVNLLKLSRLLKAGEGLNEWLDEVRQLLHYEVDYRREAEMTMRFEQRLQHDSVFSVAKIYQDYCTETLLVMSYEEGFAVNNPEVMKLPQARRNRLGKAFLQLFIHEVFDWGELQTDPNFGNYRIQFDSSGAGSDRIVLLDFGAVMEYDRKFLQIVKSMILAAYQDSYEQIRQGAIDLEMMQEHYPEQVHEDFAALCRLLLEPFVHKHENIPAHALNAEGEYCWANSQLPKRAAKHAASSAMSKYFAIPPKEFAFLSRKLLGVYSFIAVLQAEFNPDDILLPYLE